MGVRGDSGGTIRERTPGVWQIRVRAGKDIATGKDRVMTSTVRGSSVQADRALKTLVRAARAGNVDQASVTVGWLLDQHLADLEAKGRQAATVRTARIYAGNLKAHIGHLRVARLNAGHLDGCYTALLRSGRAPRTVRHHHALIHAALQRALRWDLVDRNVADAVQPPTVPPANISTPTPADVQRLLAAAADHDPLLAVLLAVAATTGARRGELCGLRWSDLDPGTGTLTIARAAKEHGPDPVGPTKTHQTRVLALDPATLGTLLAWQATQEAVRAAAAVAPVADPYMFSRDPTGGARPAPTAITHAFIRLRRQLDLDHVQLKSLRHFAATQMLAGGIDLRTTAGRLGHSGGGATTLKVYAHTLPEADQRAAALLAALVQPCPS